jgi:hypothetical protein
MAVSLALKRIFVLVLSVALLVISIVDITMSLASPSIFGIIVNGLVIVGSFGGMVGAYRMEVRHLSWFLWSLIMLLALQAAFLIYAWLHWHHSDAWNHTQFNIVTTVLLVLGAIATWDLERSAGSHDPLHESLV